MSTSLRTLRPLLGVTVLALAGLNAYAHGMPTGMGGHGMRAHAGEHAGRMAERHGQRLDALKAKLQLSSAQEAAWTAFTGAMQARPTLAGHMQQHQEMMRLSTPERLERMKALRAQHQAEMSAFMDRRAEATQAFYAALTPEQQKVFDAETARMMQGHGHGHRHGGEGHSHPGPQGRG